MSYEAGSPETRFYKQQMRSSLRMARVYRTTQEALGTLQPMAIVYRQRAADYRECLIDQMRRRQGWTLKQRIEGRKA